MYATPVLELSAAPREEIDQFTPLYQACHGRLLAYLRRSSPGADHEAVVQETFCRALAHIDEVAAMADPWPWLVVVSRNLIRNSVRDGRDVQPAGLFAENASPDGAPSPVEQLLVTERLRHLGRAVLALPPVQRQLLSMMVADGLSAAEAGRRLGLRESTARQQICRLRTRLAQHMQAYGDRLALAPILVWQRMRRRVASQWWAQAQAAGAGPTFSLAAITAFAAVAVSPLAAGTASAAGGGLASVARVTHVASPVRGAANLSHPQSETDSANTAQSESVVPDRPLPAPATAKVGVAKNPTREGQTEDVEVDVAGTRVGVSGQQTRSSLEPVCDVTPDEAC